MQFSTDLPYGSKAIQRHIYSCAKLPMNVTPEADAALCASFNAKIHIGTNAS